MWLWGFVWKCISGISWWIIMFYYEIATKSLGVISNFQTQPHAVFNQQVQSFKMLTYPKLPISVDPCPLGTGAFAPLPDFWVPPTRNSWISWSPTVQTKPGIPFLLKNAKKSQFLIVDIWWMLITSNAWWSNSKGWCFTFQSFMFKSTFCHRKILLNIPWQKSQLVARITAFSTTNIPSGYVKIAIENDHL